MCTGGVLNPDEPFGRHGLGLTGYLIPKGEDKKDGPLMKESNKTKLKTNEST